MSERREHDDRKADAPDAGTIAGVLAVAAFLGALAILPVVATTLVGAGSLPHASVVRLVIGGAHVLGDGLWSRPWTAYPPAVTAQMPTSTLTWWLTAGGTAAVIAFAAARAWIAIDTAMAREYLGRRPYDLRGSRPRAWALPRDLRQLADKRNKGGFILGTIDGRTLRSNPEGHIALIAPTRAGKTTRYVIPWLLEHDGPAIVTSTKRDVLDATREHRQRLGQVWVYDPFHEDTCWWNPLRGCEDWTAALQTATWLADATQEGDSEVASYWRGEAAKLLAPLIHAAALGERSMGNVLAWLDVQEFTEPAEILASSQAVQALRQLQSTASLDDRNRGTTFMSAGSVLAAYRYPALQRRLASELTLDEFFNGGQHTLYLVAADRHQRLLTPIIVALLASLLHGTGERTGALPRRLRVLLDEAANIAPLADLPAILAHGGGHGLRIATVWQTIAQMTDRYGNGTGSVLANSTTQVFMGPLGDTATSRHLESLTHPSGRRDRDSSVALAQLRQVTRGRAVVLAQHLAPVVLGSPDTARRRGSASTKRRRRGPS